MNKFMKNISKKKQHENGAILVVAIMVSLVMLILAVPFLFKLSAQFRITEKSYKAVSAFNLAEAGIDRSLWEINQPFVVQSGISWVDNDGTLTGTLNDLQAADSTVVGDIALTLTPPSGTEPDTRSLLATGQIPFIADSTVNRTVQVNLEKYFKSIFELGIFADEWIDGKNNIMTDSYNSNDGLYGSQTPGDQGHMGTNGSGDQSIWIQLGNSSEVNGNLASGYGTDLDQIDTIIDVPDNIFPEDEDGDPAGTKTALSSPYELPSVDLLSLPPKPMFDGSEYDFTSWFDGDGNLNTGVWGKGSKTFTKNSTSTLTGNDNGIYTDFIFNKQADVVIDGNVVLYVTGYEGSQGQFKMDVGSSLTINPGSSLTLILGNTSFSMQNNTVNNQTNTPENLLILGTPDFLGPMTWENNVDTYAAIYVPDAAVDLTAQGGANINIYGAVICDTLEMKVNTNIHYDEALADLDWIKGGTQYWKITSWQENIGQD